MSELPLSTPHPVHDAIEDREWVDFAICRSLGDLFFEPFREPGSARAEREASAKRVCAQCPVVLACRDAGRRNHETGIWGGETDEERALAGYPIRTIVRRTVAAAVRQGQAGTADGVPPGPDHEAA